MRANKAVLLVILICFLFNTVVSDLAFGLATPSELTDIVGIQHKDMGRIKLALEEQLVALVHPGLPVNIGTFQTILKEQSVKEKTIFQPADMQFFFHETKLTNAGLCVMCRLNDKYGLRTYYATFSLQKDENDGFPITIYTEEQYKGTAGFTEGTPQIKAEDTKAINRYVQHEKGVDAVIAYAHEHGLAKTPSPTEFNYKGFVEDMLERVGVKVTNPENLIPIQDRKFYVVKLTNEIYNMITATPAVVIDAEGKEHRVLYGAHSSNDAIHVFVNEEAFEALTTAPSHAITYQRALEEVESKLSYEIGVPLGLPVAVDNAGRLSNELSRRTASIAGYSVSDSKRKELQANPLEVAVINLDHVKERDYAAGQSGARTERIVSDGIEINVYDGIYSFKLDGCDAGFTIAFEARNDFNNRREELLKKIIGFVRDLIKKESVGHLQDSIRFSIDVKKGDSAINGVVSLPMHYETNSERQSSAGEKAQVAAETKPKTQVQIQSGGHPATITLTTISPSDLLQTWPATNGHFIGVVDFPNDRHVKKYEYQLFENGKVVRWGTDDKWKSTGSKELQENELPPAIAQIKNLIGQEPNRQWLQINLWAGSRAIVLPTGQAYFLMSPDEHPNDIQITRPIDLQKDKLFSQLGEQIGQYLSAAIPQGARVSAAAMDLATQRLANARARVESLRGAEKISAGVASRNYEAGAPTLQAVSANLRWAEDELRQAEEAVRALGQTASPLPAATDEITTAISLASEAGLQIPTHPNERYNLLVTSEFFANGELEEHRAKYGDRFDLDRVSGVSPEQFVDNILAKATGKETKTITLVSNDLPTEQLERLTKVGIRFIRVNTTDLQKAKADKDADREKFQIDTYAMMLLLRRIDNSITADSSIYQLLSFYLKSHFALTDKLAVDDYIMAIVTGDVARLIKGCLAYRPAQPYEAPNYNNVAASLISA